MREINVNSSFAGTGNAWKRRKRQRIIRRCLAGAAAFVVMFGVVFAGVKWVGSMAPSSDVIEPNVDVTEPDSEDNQTLVQSEGSGEGGIQLLSAAADAFLDIRGAPMIITLPEGFGMGARRVVLTKQIDPNRARKNDEVRVIEDMLFDATQRVQLTLPSSSSDLAAFQARRETAIIQTAPVAKPLSKDVVIAGAQVTLDDSEGSWGEVLGGHDHSHDDATVSYIDTVIENTITEVVAIRSTRRVRLFRDALVRLEAESQLKDVLRDQGISEAETERVLTATLRHAERKNQDPKTFTSLPKGGLVALRIDSARPDANVLQLSLYTADRYLISLSQPGPGRFEESADPWFSDKLLEKASRALRARGSQGEVNLKDAVYSTALRNGLPSELVGELMVMLSRVQDLNRIATKKDRLRIILGESGRNTAPAGQILYASIKGPDIDFKCYVLRPQAKEAPYGCYDSKAPSGGRATPGGTLGGGFLIPVAGYPKTSGFGPRFHPILKKMVNHNGVDWAAPIGTPVQAVAAGKIVRANFSPSYGNIIYIDHPGGRQSRYAHLNKFSPGIAPGSRVEAGQLIGFVGTTGRSTGPHLHFELHVNGRPVDPLALGAAPASGAVEALVSQIIRVESAGDARAKNTRSSATGLGQFINSTWLRMMRTYRPDLAKHMSKAEMLELRFDPELSRTMVTNLARENEAFLRARGHAITPGRLYLAHFLGPSGANLALKSDQQATVLAVMGAGVVSANPFLKGRTVGWMTNWADRKMSRMGKGRSATTRVTPAAPRVEPAEVKRYKEGIKALLVGL